MDMTEEWNDLDMVVDDSAVEQKDAQQKNDFAVLPKGTYPFTISKVEFSTYTPKPGKTTGITSPCKQIKLGLVVDGGDAGRGWVDENLYFFPTCMFKILSVFKACGLIADGFKGSLPWDQLKGATGDAKFDVETYFSKKYERDETRMVVKTFLKPNAVIAQAAKDEDF